MKYYDKIKRPIAFAFILLIILPALFGCSAPKSSEADLMSVHFIDVGQGDCELVITPNGETMLIDAGVPDAGDDVVSYISSLGISEIDVFVASHYHEDHIGGSHDVFKAFDILSVLMLDTEVTTSCAKKLLDDVKEEESEVFYAKRGYEFSLGEAELLVLSPEKITDNGGNDDSIVLRMQYKDARYIFTGDAEKDAEEDMLSFYDVTELSCDVLKLGHHGSRTSTTDEFISAADPSIAVISCANGNSYGHPHKETLERVGARVAHIYRTDVFGSVVIVTDGYRIYIWDDI